VGCTAALRGLLLFYRRALGTRARHELSIGKESHAPFNFFASLLEPRLGSDLCGESRGLRDLWLAPPTAGPEGPVVKYEMDPIRIDATKGPAGMQIEAYDAP